MQRQKQLREQELKRKLEEEEEEEKKKRAEEADRKAKEAEEANKSEASDKPSEPSSKQSSKVGLVVVSQTHQAMKNAKIRQQRTFYKNVGLGERQKTLVYLEFFSKFLEFLYTFLEFFQEFLNLS